ncbi:hypothetical protein J6590_103725, partial [Homalodisca vitripennis]
MRPLRDDLVHPSLLVRPGCVSKPNISLYDNETRQPLLHNWLSYRARQDVYWAAVAYLCPPYARLISP